MFNETYEMRKRAFEERRALEEELLLGVQGVCIKLEKSEDQCNNAQIYENLLDMCDKIFVVSDIKKNAIDCIKHYINVLVTNEYEEKVKRFKEAGIELIDNF